MASCVTEFCGTVVTTLIQLTHTLTHILHTYTQLGSPDYASSALRLLQLWGQLGSEAGIQCHHDPGCS